MRLIYTAVAIAAASLATPASAVTYEIQNGKLVAVRGIYGNPRNSGDLGVPDPYIRDGVSTQVYTDIEFIDGTFGSIFDKSGDPTSFTAASRRIVFYLQAYLVDNVSINGTIYNFDSRPDLIRGCTDINLCAIAGGIYDPETPDYTRMSTFNNYASGPNDFEGPPQNLTIDSSLQSNAVYAKLTSYVVSTSLTSAVPEPSSWAMMIGGIGVVGGAMRRQRKVRTTVAFA